MRPFPRHELLEVLTVGVPFCGFKIISGLIFRGGLVLIIWGVLDLLINLTNCFSLIVLRKRAMGACLFNLILEPTRMGSDLGNALDILVSFTIVAVVIGAGFITKMDPQLLRLWNICVIFNVMGAGLGRFGESLKKISQTGS